MGIVDEALGTEEQTQSSRSIVDEALGRDDTLLGDWKSRYKKMETGGGFQSSAAQSIYNVGQIAGGVGDIIGRAVKTPLSGLKALYDAAAPDYIKEGFNDIGNLVKPAVEMAGEAYSKLPQGVQRGLETAVNIGSLLPMGQGTKTTSRFVGNTPIAEGQIARKSSLFDRFMPSAEKRAGETLSAAKGDSAFYPLNARETAAIENEIPGFKAAIGEARNDPGLIKLQRALVDKPGDAANIALDKKAANLQALKDHLAKNFPDKQGIEEVIAQITKHQNEIETKIQSAQEKASKTSSKIVSKDVQQSGKEIITRLVDTMDPVLKEVKRLFESIGDYSIGTKNTETAFDDAFKSSVGAVSEADKDLQKMKAIFDKKPKTVLGLMGVERDVDNIIYNSNATPSEKHFMNKIKEGLVKDREELGAAAESGDIAISNGSIIHPARLQEELSNISNQMAAAMNAESRPDIDTIAKALKEKGSRTFMKVTGESLDEYGSRIIKEYADNIGGEVPTLKNVDSAKIKTLKAQQDNIRKTLESAQPAENVAEQIKTAKKFAETQQFDRFDKGAVREILKYGNEPNKRAVADGSIAAMFMNPDDADQLIKALGGQKQAAEVMEGFIAQDMESKVINASSKEIMPNALNKWLAKNKNVLDKYGITAKFQDATNAQNTLVTAQVEKDQFNKTIAAKMLNADPKRMIESAMAGAEGVSARNTGEIMQRLIKQMNGNKDAIAGLKNSFKDFIYEKAESVKKDIANNKTVKPGEFQKSMEKYLPAMNELYKDEPKKLKALQNIQKAVEIESRSVSHPFGGSDTTSKLSTGIATSAFETLVSHGSRTAGITIAIAKKIFGWVNEETVKKASDLVFKAMYDPELAEILELSKNNAPKLVVEKRLKSHMAKMALTTGTINRITNDAQQ